MAPSATSVSELRKFADKANAPIFGIDVDGKVNEWNRKKAETTGYTKNEAIGKPPVSTFIAPKLSKTVKHILDNTVAPSVGELRKLVDDANAPIFGIDINGNVNEWNRKTAEITGFTKNEAFGKPLVSTYIEPKLRKAVQDIMDNALQGNETSNYELEFRTKSDEIRYLLVNATTRRDADNCIVGVVGVAQDVTEAAKHDSAVGAIARELRQLVDTANAPIFGIDVHGNVNEWNFKTAEITGYSKEEAFGKALVSTFIVPQLRNTVQEILDNALKGNETSN
jgi:PAS domain S-box-containing protein